MGKKIAWCGGSHERLCLEEFRVNKEADVETALIGRCRLKLRGVMERTVVEKYPECLGNAGSRLAMLCRGAIGS